MVEEKKFRILSLDGGGSKGIYTLGVLHELEKKLGGHLHEHFDLIYGASTGAIIACGIAIGLKVEKIIEFYFDHIPKIMGHYTSGSRSKDLHSALHGVFLERTFADVKTDVGIVAANVEAERPAVFKSNVKFAHGSQATFVPGFGVKMADAVAASCSAYPFFNTKAVTTANQGTMELMDGGFVANNPAFLALTDATRAFKVSESNIRVLSVGVGKYHKSYPVNVAFQWMRHITSASFLEKQFNINCNTLTTLFLLFSKDIKAVRIEDAFPDVATSLFERNVEKLKKIQVLGRTTYGIQESRILELFST